MGRKEGRGLEREKPESNGGGGGAAMAARRRVKVTPAHVRAAAAGWMVGKSPFLSWDHRSRKCTPL